MLGLNYYAKLLTKVITIINSYCFLYVKSKLETAYHVDIDRYSFNFRILKNNCIFINFLFCNIDVFHCIYHISKRLYCILLYLIFIVYNYKNSNVIRFLAVT